MKEATKIIYAFIQIIKERNPAFSPTAWQALSELDRALENLTSDTNKDVVNIILDWCDKHPEIKPALRNTRADIVESEEQQPINYDNPNEAQIINNKFLVQKTIKEAIQQSPPNTSKQ